MHELLNRPQSHLRLQHRILATVPSRPSRRLLEISLRHPMRIPIKPISILTHNPRFARVTPTLSRIRARLEVLLELLRGPVEDAPRALHLGEIAHVGSEVAFRERRNSLIFREGEWHLRGAGEEGAVTRKRGGEGVGLGDAEEIGDALCGGCGGGSGGLDEFGWGRGAGWSGLRAVDCVVCEEENGLLHGDVEKEELVAQALRLVRAEVIGCVLQQVGERALEGLGLHV